MAEIRDAEYYLNLVVSTIKANLNSKIIQINAVKNDGSTVRTIDDNAYYYLTFGQERPYYDPCVIFGVESEQTGEIGGLTTETLRIVIEILASDQAELNSLVVAQRMQRYRRAVLEILKDNYRKFRTTRIVGLPEIPFVIDNGIYHVTGAGVEINYDV